MKMYVLNIKHSSVCFKCGSEKFVSCTLQRAAAVVLLDSLWLWWISMVTQFLGSFIHQNIHRKI